MHLGTYLVNNKFSKLAYKNVLFYRSTSAPRNKQAEQLLSVTGDRFDMSNQYPAFIKML